MDIWPGGRSFGVAVEPFPLTTLLALRQREEEAAEAAWATTLSALRTAEARLAALGEEVEAARGRLESAQAGAKLEQGAHAAADVAAGHRFVARRRDEWKAAVAAEAAFRSGPLVAARSAEGEARAAHAEKWRGLEAVEKQKEQWQTEAHRQAERRAEDARDDLTAATRHRRSREG